ncbi:PKD domain-containing protein [Brachybacterium muris]|uniref:PKD domain-containing protein n=1 Tax=Brachybacterium muris TaxID=219301 RepID=UPI00223AAEDD|nr:PKD domain-containing protein [Brachybacterium muris]
MNVINVLYADPTTQTLETELLGVPVQVRAIPIQYHWDLGDGNTITTKKPGKPYPSEQVTATYTQEGWYDITLTTTFAGQFSVDGGEWQDIDGTIEIASDPVPLFSKSLESRLVNPDIPVDEEGDPWIPARTPDAEGHRDPAATHREL